LLRRTFKEAAELRTQLAPDDGGLLPCHYSNPWCFPLDMTDNMSAAGQFLQNLALDWLSFAYTLSLTTHENWNSRLKRLNTKAEVFDL
jgi:hypothetical protein